MKEAEEHVALSRFSLYEQVADQLEERILKKDWAEGEKLPSEIALAKEYAVSRTVIREALKLLKERGLVVSRNGTGSFVSCPDISVLGGVLRRMAVLKGISEQQAAETQKMLRKISSGAGGNPLLYSLEKAADQLPGLPGTANADMRKSRGAAGDTAGAYDDIWKF